MKCRISWTALLVATLVLDFIDVFANFFLAGIWAYKGYEGYSSVIMSLFFLSTVFGVITNCAYQLYLDQSIFTVLTDPFQLIWGSLVNLYRLCRCRKNRELRDLRSEIYEINHTYVSQEVLLQVENSLTHVTHVIFRVIPLTLLNIHAFTQEDGKSENNIQGVQILMITLSAVLVVLCVLLTIRMVVHLSLRHLVFKLSVNLSKLTEYVVLAEDFACKNIRKRQLKPYKKAQKVLYKLSELRHNTLGPFMDLSWLLFYCSDTFCRGVSISVWSDSQNPQWALFLMYVVVCFEITFLTLFYTTSLEHGRSDKFLDQWIEFVHKPTPLNQLFLVLKVMVLVFFFPIICMCFSCYKFILDFGNKHNPQLQRVQHVCAGCCCIVIPFMFGFSCAIYFFIMLTFFMLNQVPIICFSMSLTYSACFFNERYDYNPKSSYRYFTVTVWWVGAFICFRYMQNVFCLYLANVTDADLIYAFMAVSSIQILAVMSIVYLGFLRSDHLFKRLAFYLAPDSLEGSLRDELTRSAKSEVEMSNVDDSFFKNPTRLHNFDEEDSLPSTDFHEELQVSSTGVEHASSMDINEIPDVPRGALE